MAVGLSAEPTGRWLGAGTGLGDHVATLGDGVAVALGSQAALGSPPRPAMEPALFGAGPGRNAAESSVMAPASTATPAMPSTTFSALKSDRRRALLGDQGRLLVFGGLVYIRSSANGPGGPQFACGVPTTITSSCTFTVAPLSRDLLTRRRTTNETPRIFLSCSVSY